MPPLYDTCMVWVKWLEWGIQGWDGMHMNQKNLTKKLFRFGEMFDCNEGKCMLHQTQEAPVNNLTPSVYQENCVKSEMIDDLENNILVISDEDHDDHTEIANVVCHVFLQVFIWSNQMYLFKLLPFLVMLWHTGYLIL